MGETRDRWHRQLSDEISEVVAHGGRGSMLGLLEHLRVRFGNVGADDLVAAMAMAPAHVRENFCHG